MKPIKIRLGSRPHYFRGQLLLETDFRREQAFHIESLRRHNREQHGWGIVRGLDLAVAGPHSISVRSGAAIDRAGRDLHLEEAINVDLSQFAPNDRIDIGLAYEEETVPDSGPDSEVHAVASHAFLSMAAAGGQPASVHLGTIQLDGRGQVTDDGIDGARRHYSQLALHEGEQRFWRTSPFRPMPIVNERRDEPKEPEFLVGVTQARSESVYDKTRNDGAGGTMALAIPRGARRVTRFRVAGPINDGNIRVELVVGGWDPLKKQHVRRIIVESNIPKDSPFEQTWDVPDGHFDPEYNTLCVLLRGSGPVAISLVAVEFLASE